MWWKYYMFAFAQFSLLFFSFIILLLHTIYRDTSCLYECNTQPDRVWFSIVVVRLVLFCFYCICVYDMHSKTCHCYQPISTGRRAHQRSKSEKPQQQKLNTEFVWLNIWLSDDLWHVYFTYACLGTNKTKMNKVNFNEANITFKQIWKEGEEKKHRHRTYEFHLCLSPLSKFYSFKFIIEWKWLTYEYVRIEMNNNNNNLHFSFLFTTMKYLNVCDWIELRNIFLSSTKIIGNDDDPDD